MHRALGLLIAALAALGVFAPAALAKEKPSKDWFVTYVSGEGVQSKAPATDVKGTDAFDIPASPDVAAFILTSSDRYIDRGDLTGDVVTATFTVTGLDPVFGFGGDQCDTAPANTRLFFIGDVTTSFELTDLWWSNPVSASLSDALGQRRVTISAPLDPAQWSDFDGTFGDDPSAAAGFADTASHVQRIGLSFGGGCFFSNGVDTTAGSATFALEKFEVKRAHDSH